VRRRYAFDPKQRKIAAIALVDAGAVVRGAVKVIVIRPRAGPGIAVAVGIEDRFG